jgi:hypothetical protein
LPCLVVSPLNLVPQWEAESHKFLDSNHWAVLPFVSMADTAVKQFFQVEVPAAAQRVGGMGRVVIVASIDVSHVAAYGY